MVDENRSEQLLTALRAIAEPSRLRLLFIISHGEFNVTELTQILGQSQPRISRHLKLLVDAQVIERHREGSWVLFRMAERETGGALARLIADLLSADDPFHARDLARIETIRAERANAAMNFFRSNAGNWDRIRSLHIAEDQVEEAVKRVVGSDPVDTLLDVGTGTGRILELLGPRVRQGIGLDMSREMLAVARARLDAAALRHCQIRQGDIYHLPYASQSIDLVTIHQVLHFLDEPERAIAEATRVLRPGGRLLVVDFAPHEFEFLRENQAHRRLGISAPQFSAWAERAGLASELVETLPPPAGVEEGLTVSLWLAQKGDTETRRVPELSHILQVE
ncbi:ubiquinone/menaquinone biosynthesis C-methylase UbiE/DNA-binding transcriptional ArsR family regulator [Rhodoligotrophos appendicifer]|uniref:ArsR/SmtB family transcription factor n=1 Tax=Rhodoligotrophos appendicifer TaxID=987056 RepID=UPI001185A570|nr:metalloregulator ArsR/SmtB family transcription factor [Rhodoligotrophos appendicifer]